MQLRSIFVKTGAGLPPLITATEPASARATGGFFTRARSGRSPFWALLLMMLERIYSGVAGLLTFVGIGRAYGPAVAGDFAFATSTLMLLAGFALVTCAQAIVPRMIAHPAIADRIANAVFLIRLAWCAMLLVIAAALCIVELDGLRRTAAVAIGSMVIVLEPFMIGSLLSQARGHFGQIASVRLATATTRLVVVVAGVLLRVPPAWLVLAWLAEHAVLVVLQVRILGWMRPANRRILWRSARWRILKPYFVTGILFLPSMMAGQFFLRIDRLYLADALPADVYGVYASGMQFLDAWLIIPQILGLVLSQRYLYSSSGKVTRRGAAILLAALGAAGIGGGFLVAEISVAVLPELLGQSFSRLRDILPWMFGYAAINFLDYGLLLILMSMNRPGLILFKWVIASATVVGLLLVLTPSLGALAGPASLTAALLVSDLFIAAIWKRHARSR
jgi:O-antigen/teichoic acid export membrane protein